MSWAPQNLAQSCTAYTTITSCQTQTFMFLQLITQLFGYSIDTKNQNSFDNFDNFYRTSGANFGSGPEEYDFIIVGGGSAGCVLANRLSEISKWRILLLEAGDEEPEVASVPAFEPVLQRSSIDWNFMLQPDRTSCWARRNGQCVWAQGKVLGGSSVINYMIYIRGHPRDYDEWAEMGNHGWSYSEVLPYFIKSEDNQEIDKVASDVHGVGGYLSVDTFPYQDINVQAVLQAYKEAGLNLFDQNSGEMIGASLLQTTSRNGRRHSTNAAFIRPIRRKRKNLVIETKAYALRVLIDPKTKNAYGVEYEKDGQLIHAVARKEVIVSSGAIMTPKILMLSGIGPAFHLKEHGIEVLQDLAVGYNLQNHNTMDGLMFQFNKTNTLVDEEQQRNDIYLYQESQNGPLSATGGVQTNAFVQTKYEHEPGRPDIQYGMDGGNVNDILTDPILTAETLVTPVSYYDALTVRPILMNPESRGVVKLNDSDPLYGQPLIFARTWSERIDLLRMIEGTKQALTLLETPALQHLGVNLVTTPLPYCRDIQFGTDDYWACLIQAYTTAIFHASGTCKMGPASDRSAVVDPELRVYGIKRLRVVDASIMPKIVRGNTNAPVIMIAEKASDFIKATWLNNNRGH